MKYQIAEKFKSVQGEGIWAGTPMAFIRFVGCSVGKKICHGCDTDFDRTYPWLGGGEFSEAELLAWASPYRHICLTGGEPFDQDLLPFFARYLDTRGVPIPNQPSVIHIETSGTKEIPREILACQSRYANDPTAWICCSPKPGFLRPTVEQANEVKVIVPGLGSGDGWPTLDDAINWSESGMTVFLQPRNEKHAVNWDNIALVNELVKQYPKLRMSVQMHKLLKVR